MRSWLVSLTVIPLAVGVSNQGWLKTFKDLTLYFQHETLIGITFENKQWLLVATAANEYFLTILLLDNILVRDFVANYFQIDDNISVSDWRRIFWWEILLLIIFRLVTILLWVIGAEYFGERDVGKYFQIRKPKIEIVSCVFDSHATCSLLLLFRTEVDLKLLK